MNLCHWSGWGTWDYYSAKFSDRSIRENLDELEKLSSSDLEQELFSSPATEFFHPLKSGWRNAVEAADDSSPTGKSISFTLPEIYSLRSAYLPVVPGKTYRLELWVKGSDVLGAKIRMDTYMGPLEGKHCYRDVNVSVSKSWKKARNS